MKVVEKGNILIEKQGKADKHRILVRVEKNFECK